MKRGVLSSAVLPLLALSFAGCDRLATATSSESSRVVVVPRFASGATVPMVSRVEGTLSAMGQSDSVVNIAYAKGADLSLGSVPSGSAFRVALSGYDSSSGSRIVRWNGSGSGTAAESVSSQYVTLATDSGPAAPTGSASGATVPATLTLASGAYYTTDGSDPRVSGTVVLSSGSVSVTSAGTVKAATKTMSGTTALWSAVSNWTFTAAGGTATKRRFTLTVPQLANGTIALNPTGGVYDSGSKVIATATANTGYVFSAWTGASTSTVSVCTLTVTKDTTLSASFSASSSGTTNVGPGVKLIPAGTFTMGSATTENGHSTDETQHSVTLSSFYMDSTDVTQGQYQAVMGVNPSHFSTCGSTCPVENVTWFDAVLYCNARSKMAGLDTVYSYTAMTGTYGNGVSALAGIATDLSKSGYRLPTEAEWEYAARGGTTTAYYWGDDTSTATVSKYEWYANNSFNITHAVAIKLPNAYHLYDMAGNVWQWTNDWYGAYSSTSQTNPSGPASGVNRVFRGGSWLFDASYLRLAFRGNISPDFCHNDFGFRSVRLVS